jgi:alanine racemase
METMPGIFPDARVHALNSAGVLGFAGHAYDLARVGLMLYGSAPLPEHQASLQPVMTWKSRVGLVRDVPAGRTVSYGRTFVTPRAMRLATVAVGYADGYPRHASNAGACVLIGGRRCPVVGRITMDQIVVASDDAEIDSEVVLLGRQGGETILAAELADWAGTIAWDIFTGIGGRTVRPAP